MVRIGVKLIILVEFRSNSSRKGLSFLPPEHTGGAHRGRIDIKGEVTEMPILEALKKLSLPIVVGQSMHMMYNIIDTLWVGRLGAEELAAISFSFPVIFTVFSLGAGFSISGSALVSQYRGARQRENANHAGGQVFVFATSIAMILGTVGFFNGESILHIMGAEPEVLPLAWSYFRIICAGIPLMFLYFVFEAVFRATGNTHTPMVIKIGTSLLNIILDPLLIFGIGPFPFLGIEGAAIATVVSRAIGAAIGLYLLFSGTREEIHIRPVHLIPDARMIRLVFAIGTPAALGLTAIALARAFMTGVVAGFGTYAVAAWGAGNRILTLLRMPAIGTSQATTILVGQHLGAGNVDRAEESAWKSAQVSFVLLMLAGSLVALNAPAVISIFNNHPEVVAVGTVFLRLGAFAYVALALQMVIGGALRGAGNTIEDTVLRVITQWVLQIPLAIYLSGVLGVNGIWWAILLAFSTGALMSVLWFRRGTWKDTVI